MPELKQVQKKIELCLVLAPPSKRCSPNCKCIMPKGHQTPHRAYCGQKWKQARKRHARRAEDTPQPDEATSVV